MTTAARPQPAHTIFAPPRPRFLRLVTVDPEQPTPTVCPELHRIHFNGRIFDGRGHVTCTYREARDRAPCGAVMLVVAGLHGRDGSRLRYEIEVHYEELREIERRHLELLPMLEYLGVPWPARALLPGEPPTAPPQVAVAQRRP